MTEPDPIEPKNIIKERLPEKYKTLSAGMELNVLLIRLDWSR